MAASTTTSSPTSQPVQAASIDSPDRKMPPVGKSIGNNSQVNDADTLTTSTQTEPTYLSSESSYWYVSGKKFLEDGDFESGLQIIEEGIDVMKNLVAKYSEYLVNTIAPVAAAAASAVVQDATDEGILHESMAPLHYLYGTILLYSIEESDFNQAMTIGGQVPVQQDSSPIEDNDEEEYNDDDNDVKVAAVVDDDDTETENQYGEEEGEENNENQQPTDDGADDIQIAWENLDLARTIIEAMLAKQNESIDKSFTNKLKADLAQVYLREADLQKMNNKYEDCIADYNRCLELLQTDGIIRNERKIADVHYNLGLTYFLHVTARMSSGADEGGDDQETTTERKPLTDEDQEKLSIARCHGFYHYVKCAMTLGGIVAEHCQVDATEFINSVLIGISNMKGSSDDGHDCMEDAKIASLKVKLLREKIQTLAPPTSEMQETCDSLKELIDEIQETIDNAEQSEQGVQEVTAMKEQITRAVADQSTTENDFSGNTIGETITMPTTTIGFGSSSSVAVTAAAEVPVTATLLVRKKAKRAPEQSEVEDESKNDTCKRLKITE